VLKYAVLSILPDFWDVKTTPFRQSSINVTHLVNMVITKKGVNYVNCIEMAFDNSWCVVNLGLNIYIYWKTQPIFWLAFALSSDSTSAWSWDSSFWNWQ
jgi:hypothetical protein